MPAGGVVVSGCVPVPDEVSAGLQTPLFPGTVPGGHSGGVACANAGVAIMPAPTNRVVVSKR
jgi:hypothetical protein